MPFPASFCQSALRLVGGLTGRRRPGILGLPADEAGQHHSPRRLGPPGLPFIGAVLVSIWLGKVVAQLGQTTSVEARRPLALALLDQAAMDPRDSSKSPAMVRAPDHETQGAPFPTRQYRVRGPLSGQRPLQLLRFADPPGPGATTSIAHAEATPGKPRQSVRGRTVTRGQRLTEAGTLGSREMTLVRAQIAMQLRFRC